MSCYFFQIVYTQCYLSSDEKVIEIAARYIGQYIKRQIKWSVLSMMLLGKLRYILDMTFSNQRKIRYSATLLSRRCRISQLILHFEMENLVTLLLTEKYVKFIFLRDICVYVCVWRGICFLSLQILNRSIDFYR